MSKATPKKYKQGNPTTKLELFLDHEISQSNNVILVQNRELDRLRRELEKTRETAEEQAFVDRFRECMALFLHEASQQAMANANEAEKRYATVGGKGCTNADVWRKVNRELFRLATQYAAKG